MAIVPHAFQTHLQGLLATGLPSSVGSRNRPFLLLAFSGGLDSTVLLHLLVGARAALDCEVSVIHVHHGLQTEADAWQAHCETVCTEWNVPFAAVRVQAHPGSGESPEAAARAARYRALAGALPAGGVLLTAHHQDDQAETLLLQLLRGAGPRGLAAMPHWAHFGAGYQARPLLADSRAELLEYAHRHRLRWIDDPSNAYCQYDRNFLRHRVVPLLRERWPAATHTLARSAAVCADASQLLDETAAADLVLLRQRNTSILSVSGLIDLASARRRNVLLHWFNRLGLPGPASAHLARIEADVLAARLDANPCVRWPGVAVRRYRDGLYALAESGAVAPTEPIAWDGQPLAIPGYGVLSAVEVLGQGISRRLWQSGPVQLRFRSGGEHFRPHGVAHTRTLKNWLQENAVPPWERKVLPLVYVGETLLGIGDLALADGVVAAPDEIGLVVIKSPTPVLK